MNTTANNAEPPATSKATVVTAEGARALEDDAQFELDDVTRELIEIVCLSGVTSVICAIGVPANVISCLVFWRQGLTDRMNLCLFCLALVDSCHLLSEFVFSVTSYIRAVDNVLGEQGYLKAVAVWLGVTYGLRSTSGFVGLVIAVDRCVCVVFPLRASHLMRTHTMAAVIMLSFVTFQLCFIVSPLSIRAAVIRAGERDQWVLGYSQVYQDNQEFFEIFGNIVLGMVVPVTNFVVVSVATTVTVMKLRSALAWRQKSSSAGSDIHGHQLALTSVLVLVSFAYIITMVPFVVHTVTRMFVADFSATGRFYKLFMATNAIVHAFPRINSSLGFFVYFCRSSRFQQTLRAIFSCTEPRKTSTHNYAEGSVTQNARAV